MAVAYDPWQKVKTIGGFDADLVISALQKEIRRGNEENAVLLAYEMFSTSLPLEDFMWTRLHVISVEDIGFANPEAPMMIMALDNTRKSLLPGSWDSHIIAVHAVRYLAKSLKDRSSDEMLNWVDKNYKKGLVRPEIPSYAYDKHTRLGQEMGKNDHDFYYEGSIVKPEWEERDKTYRERLLVMLEESGGKNIK